jgi:hypothetical protein
MGLYSNGWKRGKDILICMKHMWPKDPTNNYKKYIYDVCDDHFNTEHKEHYYKHCENADLITCNSEVMGEIILEKTGRVPFVIPDPIEFDTQPAHYSKSFLCFGHEWNVSLLTTKQNVIEALGPYNLEIISEPFAEFVTPYSREAMIKGFSRAGAVLIPVGKKMAKSANRLIESINAGCFVICNSMPAYDEFKEYAFIGDLAEGITWYLRNPSEALEKVREGQKYIKDRCTIDHIGPMWGEAIGAC